MKTFLSLLAYTLFFGLMVACKDDSANPNPVVTASGQTDLLVANPWLLDRVNDTSGQPIATGKLNLATTALYYLTMEFKANNTVRALDAKTKQVVNGGTWYLTADNKAIDVNVTGFKGQFPLVDLSRSKMTLRQRAPVNGVDTDVNLEFKPSL